MGCADGVLQPQVPGSVQLSGAALGLILSGTKLGLTGRKHGHLAVAPALWGSQ